MKKTYLATIVFLLIPWASAIAQDSAPVPIYQNYTSYDEQLENLYSVLGALHSISNICYHDNQKWRDFAQSLGTSENLNSLRRTRFFAAFNTSYRTLSTTYQNCTASAQQAYNLYKQQGKAIANNLLSKLAYSER